MPFHPVPLKHGLCQFTHTDCRRNCPAALADPEDQENWLCQWIESLKEMRQTMQVVTQAMQMMHPPEYAVPTEAVDTKARKR